MKFRAVIFDVYGTLLQVGPPPSTADELWKELFQDLFRTAPPLTRLDFSISCQRAIGLRHAAAHSRGIVKPEILWPAIVGEVLPAFAKLKRAAQEEFVYRQIQIGRSVTLLAGMDSTLRWLSDKGCTLGIISNAQAYTLKELENLFTHAGLSLKLFTPDLCLWSFQNGFSKPDPHVFQMLRTRLEAHHISANEALVVGDRLDNDIAPAKGHGFRTWHLNGTSSGSDFGDASKLREYLVRSV